MIIRTSAVSSMTRTLAFLNEGLAVPESAPWDAGLGSDARAVVIVSGRTKAGCPRRQKAPRSESKRAEGLTMAANRRYAVPMFSLKALSFLALLAIEMPFAAAGANPAKMAGRAQFDLSSTNVNLTGALVLTGSGQIERMGWVQGEAKNRGYTANFSISHYGWSELSIRFTPTADGIVELKLMGPYDAAPGGELYQEEVLWDKLTAQGTTLQNGSFEENSKGWSGALIETGKAVLDGKSYGRTWHNRALTTTFAVTRGEPVTLTLFARAQIPEGFHEMRQLSANSRGF